MPVQWTTDRELALLCQVLDIHQVQVSGAEWAQLAEKLGADYTATSLRKRFNTIRLRVAAGNADSNGAQGSPKTPAKADTAKKAAPSKTMKRKSTSLMEGTDDGLEDDSPLVHKKLKTQEDPRSKQNQVMKESKDEASSFDDNDA